MEPNLKPGGFYIEGGGVPNWDFYKTEGEGGCNKIRLRFRSTLSRRNLRVATQWASTDLGWSLENCGVVCIDLGVGGRAAGGNPIAGGGGVVGVAIARN